MYQNLTSKDVTARKEHCCDWCGKRIRVGEKYHYETFIFDGEFCSWHAHLACSRVASEIWDYVDPDEGMDHCQFQDGCHDVCRRFICPDCPNWDEGFEDCEKDEDYCIDRMDEFFKTHELYKAERKAYYEIWKCRQKHKED